jgi:hypothetical protein
MLIVFDENASALEEGLAPFSILAITIMLQRMRPLSWDADQSTIL